MLRARHILAAGAVGLSLAMAGCGKSGTEPSTTVMLTSEAGIDGWVTSAGIAQSDRGGPLTGDYDIDTPGVGFRQFFSFDLSAIPEGATISSAQLQVYQAVVRGQPYVVLGNLIADHLVIGPALEPLDYSAIEPIASNIGTLSTNGTIEYKRLDVTASVVSDLQSGRAHTQYRVRFSTGDSNSDHVADYVQLTDTELSCCENITQKPQLVVTFAAK